MKIVGVNIEPGPVGWHRTWNWTTAMQRLGHDVRHKPHESEQIDLNAPEKMLDGADIVVAGKMHDMKTFAALLACRDLYGYKLIVDTDDNYNETPPYNQSYADYHKGSGLARLIDAQLKYADMVTTSTPELAERIRHLNGNVSVIPNVVDTNLYRNVRSRNKESRHSDDIRIYWGGGGGHYNDLLIVKDALRRLVKEDRRVKLVFSNFVPDWAIDLPTFQVFMVRFAHFNAYPKVLRWICPDIAIAPLVDNPFNHCKSHVKYLDYGMAEVAGVYQDLPPYRTVVDGVTGLKATDNWYDQIKRLIEDPALRRSIASHAKSDILANWTIDRWAPKYESMLKEQVAVRRIEELSMLHEGLPIEVSRCLTVQS